MSVTPTGRLSDEVVGKAISQFYVDNKLLPVGISIGALDELAMKFALGLRRLVGLFRRQFDQTPTAAKSKALAQLKARLREANVVLTRSGSQSSLSRSATEEDMEALSDGKSFDWNLLAAKIMERKAEKDRKESEVLKASEGQALGRPVATPARSHELPVFVVESLKQQAAQPPAPFVAGGEDEDGQTAEGRQQAKPKPKAKAKGGKGKPSKKSKVKPPVADDEVEEALKVQEPLLQKVGPPTQAAEPCAEKATESAVSSAYMAGDFGKRRLEFIAQKRAASGNTMSFKEASNLWMLSDERASMLQGLDPVQLKRRRFA